MSNNIAKINIKIKIQKLIFKQICNPKLLVSTLNLKSYNMATVTTHNFNSYDGTSIEFTFIKPSGNNLKSLVIYFHPGGFYQGNMNQILLPKWNDLRQKLEANDISIASLEYRKLSNFDPDGLKKPLYDCMALLQYIRKNASVFRVKKNKIALLGGSAGATAAMWIAFSQNMKEIGASGYRDQSTKVTAVAAMECQATLDVTKWPKYVFNNTINLTCARNKISEAKLCGYYAASSILTDGDTINAYTAYKNNTLAYNPGKGKIKLNHLTLLNNSAPPIWLESDAQPDTLNCPDMTNANLLHHPKHPLAIYNKIQQVNANGGAINHVVRIPNMSVDVDSYNAYAGKGVEDFLVDRLL